jgi:hypothetical protein
MCSATNVGTKDCYMYRKFRLSHIVHILLVILAIQRICNAGLDFTVSAKDIVVASDSTEADFVIIVKNSGASQASIFAEKTPLAGFPSGWTHAMCAGSKCFIPTVNKSTVQIILPDSQLVFGLDITTNQISGTGKIEFSFTDSSTNEKLCIDTFSISHNSSAVLNKHKINNIGNMSIEKVGRHFSIQLTLSQSDKLNSLELFNAGGKLVKNIKFSSQNFSCRYTAIWNGTNELEQPAGKGMYYLIGRTNRDQDFIQTVIN